MTLTIFLFDFLGPFSQKVNKDIMWWIVPIAIFLPIIFNYLFYKVINKNTGKRATDGYWRLFCSFGFITSLLGSLLISYSFGSTIHPYYIICGFVFGILSIIVFIICSLYLRKKDTHAEVIPTFLPKKIKK